MADKPPETQLSAAKRELLRLRLQERPSGEQRVSGARRIRPRSQANDLPLSYAQQRFYFLEQLEPQNPDQYLPACIRMVGQLHTDALQASLALLARRHEILRTSFPTLDGQPVQHIAASVPVDLPITDLSRYRPEEREQVVPQIVERESQRPFDLASGPAWRVRLLRLGEREHLLLVNFHHIVTDGWSSSVLVRELSQAYTALRSGQEPILPPLPVQYADFACWQQEWLRGQGAQTQLTYWRDKLSDSRAHLTLPWDHPRPVVQTYRGAEYRQPLPAGMGEALSDLSRREGASLFMTMLAGFAILLLRYTGQEDLSIGTFHANRNRREIEGLIGYFLNILVLRADLSGQPTVREVIQRVRQVCLEAYEHQDLPFEKILEAIQPERERGFAPLFQVMVVMINLPDRTLHLPDLDVQVVPGGGKRSNVDLTLWLYEGSQGLTTSLEYNVDLFEERTIKRILMHYQMVLSAMVADPDQSIRAFPILSSQEYNALLQIGNGTKKSFVSELSNLVALFEAQVTRTPQAIAVIDEQEQLTYQQLNQRANQLAHILRRRGITSETCVGVCLERSCHLVAAILAILKAGGAYLPIDPGTPTERILFMLADARAPLLICQSSLAERIPDSRPATLCLDDKGWPASFAEENAENLSLTLRAGQAAYIIYTSGSTGLPKGVVGLHQGMVNRLHWMWQAYPFSANEVCCQKTSLNFVDSIAELFSPLLQGVPTVLFSSAESTDPVQLVEALARWRVSRLVLVPSLLRTLLDTFPDLATRLPSLHLWVSSGESLPLSLWQRFQETLPHRRLLNLYGSSEVSADSTFYEAKAELEQWNSIPIGRPMANTRIYLLDPSGQPVPVGVPGEIYIGGIGLNRGYLNRPDATAERFVPDSLSDEAGARLYRTGDRAVYREGGILEFLGRSDHQIKVRGVRIELGEIEKALSLVSGVQACAVTAGALEEGDISLIAYVVAQAGQPLSSKFLRRALREQLPSSMIPGYFIFLERLPLSSNGKLNRDALPEPVPELLDRSEEYVAPRTPVEEVLADIWADVLHVSRVGIYDNFFDLGGHSLSATQVITQIRQRFHVDLPVRSLFETTTLADLALLIVQEQMNQVGDEALMQLLAEVTQLSTDEIQALLPAQQRVREGAQSDE